MIYCLLRVFISTLFKVIMALIVMFILVTGYKSIDPLDQNFKTQDFFGFELLSIGSNSMYPGIKIGDGVLIKLVNDKTDIKEGDIVAYQLNEVKVVHRVIKVNEDNTYVTKGDNNTVDDGSPIPRKRIIGKEVALLPGIDQFVSTLRSPIGLGVFAVFAFSLFTFFEYLFKTPDIYFKYEQGGDE